MRKDNAQLGFFGSSGFGFSSQLGEMGVLG
jgi:hypothetical protein